ncbi:helix-turn-helix domain-containing protein [Prosthecomicrobium hirschii]|uniref:helix-turn-helix domain-containing protein n=1 Tax=Prosthecodimorpha hirschii TaxID=665126 RepID=UPI0009FA53C2|nr:helix-turn-helix transcriptional regulator [Prosthecomicrobium hirschii]
MLVSVEQVRAARGLLGWSQARLASASGLSQPTVKRFETNSTPVSVEALQAIKIALENAGVIFIDKNGEGVGVRLRKEI